MSKNNGLCSYNALVLIMRVIRYVTILTLKYASYLEKNISITYGQIPYAGFRHMSLSIIIDTKKKICTQYSYY